MANQFTTQDNVNLTITTPLGKDGLLIDALAGFEQISTPFEFHLKLRAKANNLDFSKLIGQEIQVTFDAKKIKRHFCGVVGEFSQNQSFQAVEDNQGPQYNHYEAKIYPTLWLLKFNSNHRIFQNLSTIDIIKKIFQENTLTSLVDKTTKAGKIVREFCVQYGESDFNFASRLMEEEGIFYFFEHTAEAHKLILADANSSFVKKPETAVEILKSASPEPVLNQMIYCSLHEQVVPKKFATGDYNYDVSTTPFQANVEGKGFGGRVYRYPGVYNKDDQGESRATIRIQALEWAKETLVGRSTVLEMTAGYQFTLSKHIREGLNKTYVAYRVEHAIDTTGERRLYENNFMAFDLQANFSPECVTPKPRIYGTQTAVVTGKEGEEIWTDKYGRVFVKFHWDRAEEKNEKSSCPIRVAQIWAMGQWGTLFTPRIGQEVVVTFIDGDPDRPLITGCVYNTDHLPPYLPAEPTKSTIKTNSSKGGGGANEIRFEDKKDAEEVYIHAQKYMNRVVENNRTLVITKGNDTDTLKEGNRSITLDKGDLSVELKQGDETRKITGEQSIKVTKNQTIIVGGNIIIKATGNIMIDAGGSLALNAKAGITVGAGAALSLSAGAAFTMNSGLNIQMTAATGAIVDGGPMLALKSAAMVDIQGGPMVKVTAGMVNIAGMVKFG